MGTDDIQIDDRSCKVSIPVGTSGDWRVEKFKISRKDADFHNVMHYAGREVVPGTFTRLMRNDTVVMSDTPAEVDDVLHFIVRARGSILINGLGLGVTLQGLHHRVEVIKDVTVIERSIDVIKLAGTYYQKMFGDKLTIINADALTWEPPKDKHYDYVWHDIWDGICGDNWETMKQLTRKYARKTEFQDSWCREQVRSLNKESKAMDRILRPQLVIR